MLLPSLFLRVGALFGCLMSIVLLFTSSCSTDFEEDISLRLTQRERREIDTLVSKEVKILRPYYDSLCRVNFEKEVAIATDSIVQRRLEDELRLRARIPLEKNSQ